MVAIALLLLDIAISNMLGGDISTIPRSAIGRFQQFHNNWLLGLYNHDLLNLIIQIVLLPAYLALYAALRKANRAWAGLALVIFVVGTTVFIVGNAALPMLDLSHKYAAAATEPERAMLAAAGEALLARGAHGCPEPSWPLPCRLLLVSSCLSRCWLAESFPGRRLISALPETCCC